MRRAIVLSLLALAALPATTSAAGLTARGSAEQVQVTGAKRGQKLELLDRRHRVVSRARAGKLGGAIFRSVKPGHGYRVRRGKQRTAPFAVLSTRSKPPTPKLFHQQIPGSGYGYLTTRDGTKLAIDVRLPAGAKPPYPTL